MLQKRLLIAVLSVCLLPCLAHAKPLANIPQISVAIDDSPPYSFINEHGEASGQLVTMMKSIAQFAEIDLRFVSCPWKRCLSLVSQGDVDMLIGLTKSSAREKLFHFISPAFLELSTSFAFYQPSQSTNKITRYDDLSGLLVGVLRGSAHFPAFDNDTHIKKHEFRDIESALRSLQYGRVDAFIHVEETMQPYLKAFDQANSIAIAPYKFQQDLSGYIVMSKRSSHVEKIDKISAGISHWLAEQKSTAN